MRSTLPARLMVVCVLTVLAAATGARAQETVSSSTTPTTKTAEESFEARLRYGVAVRNGTQTDALGPGLTYSGFTPNDLAFQGWAWFIADLAGLSVSFQREGFGLYDQGVRVTSGGLLRAHVAPTVRFRVGPVRLEALVGYAFHQLPDFGDSATPKLVGATRHGLLMGARVLADFGRFTLEARGEYPLTLASSDGSAAAAKANGFTAGGGVRFAMFRVSKAVVGVMADGSFTLDTLSNDKVSSTQRVIRTGLSVDLQWKDEAVVPTSGALKLIVHSASGEPLPKAVVSINAASGSIAPTLDERGEVSLPEVLAGAVVARATLEGYDAAEAAGQVSVGQDTTLTLTLTLQKQAPKVGALAITVVDKATKKPIVNAQVSLMGQRLATDSAGRVSVKDLPVGPVSVAVTAEDYQPGNDAATVVGGAESPMSIELLSATKRELATITGLVRSNRGGAPIQANLEIPEAKIKTRANEKGAFIFRLPGGTYTVTIAAKGFVTQTKQLTVKDAEQAILNVDLQPK